MASGGYAGYAFPFPKGESFSWNRIDQGQDLQGPPGGPVLAIAPGTVTKASDKFSGFGPFYPTEQIDAGPLSGRGVYYGHTKIAKSGHVNAGDVIAYTQPRANDWTAAPAGWLELGFLPYGSMSAGAAIAPMLHQLASGHLVTAVGGGGGSTAPAPHLTAPLIKGTGAVDALVQAVLNTLTSGANRQLGSSSASGGAASNSPVAGPVVTASNFGGHNDPSAFNKSTASGKIANDSLWGFAELSNPAGSLNFSALGHLPMGAKIKVGYNGKSITVPKVDVGAGGPGLNGHIRAIDLTYAANQALGAPGLENVTWARAAAGGFIGVASPQLLGSASTFDPMKSTTTKTTAAKRKKAAKTPKLPAVKVIPTLAGGKFGWSYYFDTHNGTGAPYPGGNQQAITDAENDYTYLSGMLDVQTDDTDSAGNLITGAQYSYGPDAFYTGDPGNPGGVAEVWKLDQEIAARLKILGLEQGEYNAGAQQKLDLQKFIQGVAVATGTLTDRAESQNSDISTWTKMEKYIKAKKSAQNWAAMKQKIRDDFARRRLSLGIGGVNAKANIQSLISGLKNDLTNERLQELAAVAGSNLDPVTKATERAAIDQAYAPRNQKLDQILAQERKTATISAMKAKAYLGIAESDQLFAVDEREAGYTTKYGRLSSLVAYEKPLLAETVKDLKADVSAWTASDTGPNQALSKRLDALGITVTPGDNTAMTTVQERIKSLFDDIRTERDITIGGLQKTRGSITGQAGTPTVADNQTLLDLQTQISQYALTAMAVQGAQLKQLAGFTPLMAGMVRGSYAKGGVIPETGLYLMHRDETVTSDPQGPYNSQLSGGAASHHVELNLHGDLGPLISHVEALVDSRVERVVSKNLGRRTRQITNAPGGRPAPFGVR